MEIDNLHEEKQDKTLYDPLPNRPTRIYHLAGITSRIVAYLIDLIVVMGLAGIIFNYFYNLDLGTFNWMVPGFASIGLIGVLYFSVMTRILNQTVGKIITGIRVIRLDGEPMDWKTVLFRELVGRMVSQLGGLHIGYIWVLLNNKKQSWHDLIGETLVVYTRETADNKIIEI